MLLPEDSNVLELQKSGSPPVTSSKPGLGIRLVGTANISSINDGENICIKIAKLINNPAKRLIPLNLKTFLLRFIHYPKYST